ncbi:MAG: 16S rRNA (cytosine(1402)-N(4))-methyltransferase RsmH [Pseudomonadota bacterium]
MNKPPHIPVMLDEVLTRLRPANGEHYIDATFGAGGYTRAILQSAECEVVGLDRDPAAEPTAAEVGAKFSPRFHFIGTPFSQLTRALEIHPDGFDGVVFDLGVSSMQLDTAARGFSFQADGPLDMRMSARENAAALSNDPDDHDQPSAATIVNTASLMELRDIIFQLGEEKRARRIAEAIIEQRKVQPITRTLQLAKLVEDTVGRRSNEPKHPATRTFQALRLHVNDELGELVRSLSATEQCLRPGGRLVVVTFHSLEDRIVKRFLAERSGRSKSVSRHLPTTADLEPHQLQGKSNTFSFELVNQRPLTSSQGEITANPRSRSARLRSAARTAATAWPLTSTDLGLPAITKRGLLHR